MQIFKFYSQHCGLIYAASSTPSSAKQVAAKISSALQAGALELCPIEWEERRDLSEFFTAIKKEGSDIIIMTDSGNIYKL